MGLTQPKLTPKQQAILAVITGFIKQTGQSPTVSELTNLINVKSARTVTQFLEILEAKGFISRTKYQTRGIKVLALEPNLGPGTVTVPVVSSVACGGLTVYAEPTYDEFITVDRDFLHNKDQQNVIAVRAAGNSMQDAGVDEGDYVLVEKTQNIKNGDKVVAIIDNMALLKQIQLAPDAVVLKPMSHDPEYQPIVMKKDFEVFGKMLDVIKNFNTDELVYEDLPI